MSIQYVFINILLVILFVMVMSVTILPIFESKGSTLHQAITYEPVDEEIRQQHVAFRTYKKMKQIKTPLHKKLSLPSLILRTKPPILR